MLNLSDFILGLTILSLGNSIGGNFIVFHSISFYFIILLHHFHHFHTKKLNPINVLIIFRIQILCRIYRWQETVLLEWDFRLVHSFLVE